jgi:guanylate kinase
VSGTLIIVSAPSGTGKTTILKQVMAEVNNLAFSVSHTTRAPRKGEVDGQDYRFVDKPHFEKMIQDDAFLEWAQVHDNYYGTALEPLRRQLELGYDVLLDIDVQGAGIIRTGSKLSALHVFIAPPDIAELEKRLRGRGTEDEDTVVKRLKNAVVEMNNCESYEYFIVNDRVENAARALCGIIYAERARNRRALDGQPLNKRDS